MSTTDRIQPKKLKGFRDFLPQQATLRRQITEQIWNLATLAGFQAIDTPVLEYAETLLGTGGQETDKEVYRFQDHGEREVALRFDLTVPFARFVAENQADLVFPFKKVQIGNAWRGEKPQKGRYREFCQADLDIIGVDTLAADVEVLSCILQNLERLVPGPFTMAIGHRVILSALIQECLPGIAPGAEGRALIALDKLAKIGVAAVTQLLIDIPGADPNGAEKLLHCLQLRRPNGDSDLEVLLQMLPGAEAKAEIKRLQASVDLLRRLVQANADASPNKGGSKAQVRVDLSIARGLGYYTGIVFETTIDGLDGFGSVSSGGRYNGLVSRFSSLELPGIGGSIGVDRLLAALEQLGAQDKVNVARKGVFLAVTSENEWPYAFELLQTLRQRGLLADVALKAGKLGNQFKFADKRNYATVVTIGEEEVKSRSLSLKDLATGAERRGISYEEGLVALSVAP